MKWRELELEQKKGLDEKIEIARQVIAKAFEVSRQPALAFSGGKDSTGLLDLVRRFFPEKSAGLIVIYGNTGVEYPECLKFARWLAGEWRLNFHETRLVKTTRPGFKYAGQRRIWQALIENGEISNVLKPDGKLKSTAALEMACPTALRNELERGRPVRLAAAGQELVETRCAQDQHRHVSEVLQVRQRQR
jgi:hypothetical protein